ncbi:CotH kinase family protein [Lewinella sp. LCG006]|uniref:CotH kinase family protein n=1 Tax=Lewinella sp. LCG006 TaxID=3231911 RepID=UPI00345FEA25
MRFHIVIALLFITSTLGAQSTGAVSPADSLAVYFEPAGGFYPYQQQITIQAPGASEIFYTLDGSQPNHNSQRYFQPIMLDETAVVRVVAYLDKEAGRPVGQTYFINEPKTNFPVVSIALPPYVLFNPETGIFVQGGGAVDSLWHKPGANFWTRKEYPIHLEFFEADGSQVYSSLSGMRLFGGMSRLFPQKSLALIARKQYGEPRFRMPIFGEEGKNSFKFLVLRNSGSDYGKSHFRDAFMTSLVKDWDLESQDFRPSHVYINGTYWGIYNIREKVNRYFIEAHSEGVDRDSIDFLEHFLVRKQGSRRHYQELLDFLDRYDLNLQANFDHVATYMETDNFMEHQIAQIYFDNQDAGGNIKYWRPATPGGRWRWILYDTDWGYGLHDAKAYRNNSLTFHTTPNGPHWPNPPWSTYLLRKLLQNEQFRHRFINRFADHLNTSFSEQRATSLLDSFYFLYRQEIPRHLKRWRLSEKTWESQVDIMREFAAKRPEYIRDELMDVLHVGPERELRLNCNGGGKILLNDYLEVSNFRGTYFANHPIKIRAVPAYGHRFVGWEHDAKADRELTIDLKKDRNYRFRARFEPFQHPLQDQVMINEVCPKSKKTDDWIEIYNHSEATVALKGWILTDQRNEFVFPAVDLLPNDYLVICKDANKFRETFPEAYNVIGGLGFGLNKRQEVLGLYAEGGAVVDSFAYTLPPLDSAFTLNLLLPNLDNADVENWELRMGLGSPNRANPYLIETNVRLAQSQWMQIGLAAGVFVLSLLLLYLRNRGVF